MGVDTEVGEEGTWECKLEGLNWSSDIQRFEVKFVVPAVVSMETQRGHETDHEADIYESENLEFTCEAAEGLPQPRALWKLNSKIIDFQ